MAIDSRRVTARIEGDFVVFLIGMRINRPWKIHTWLPVMGAMPRMLVELTANPDSGLLGYEARTFSRSPILIQYWRSFEHLEHYAKDRAGAHYPAWKAFNQAIGQNDDVGIWHETYRVSQYENIYVNMPPMGLGKFGQRSEVAGMYNKAAARLRQE
ncbi:MAG: DUF4188 domain-containing protein [Bacteroidia bacterium]